MTAITIERDSHSQQFVIVHNATARDKRLSRAARGLLVELLSLPPGWKVTAETLAAEGPEGRTAILRMLRELEDAGYITRSKEHLPSGKWSHRLTVRETPISAEPESGFQPLVPPAEEPTEPQVSTRVRFSDGGEPDSIRKTETQKTVKDGPPPRFAGGGGDAGLQVRAPHPTVTRANANGVR